MAQKGYWVIHVSEVKDQERFLNFYQMMIADLNKNGYKIVCNGFPTKIVEAGKMMPGIMIEFPSVEEAQSYYKSDEFQQVMKETVGNTVEDVFESQWRCVSGAEGFEAKPDGKGYWVVSVLDFINDDQWQKGLAAFMDIVNSDEPKPFTFVSVGPPVETFSGVHKTTGVLEFNSMDEAISYYKSDQYAKFKYACNDEGDVTQVALRDFRICPGSSNGQPNAKM